MQEAVRDDAPAIDLIDGDLLVEKLKELELGVRTEVVQSEEVTVDREWFGNI
jgi:restriction system protein